MHVQCTLPKFLQAPGALSRTERPRRRLLPWRPQRKAPLPRRLAHLRLSRTLRRSRAKTSTMMQKPQTGSRCSRAARLSATRGCWLEAETTILSSCGDTIVAILAPDFANTTCYVCATLRRKPSSRSRPLGPSPDAATRSHVDSRRLRLGATTIPD